MKTIYLFLFSCICFGFLSSGIVVTQAPNSNTKTTSPVLMIANKNGGVISKNELWNDSKLVFINNTNPPLHVCEFKMTTECNGKLTVLVNDKDEYLTDEMRTAIYHMEEGCKLYFEYIRVKSGRNGPVCVVQPISFTIAENK